MDGKKREIQILRAEVVGIRGRGRPRTKWVDGVRMVLCDKDINIQQTERCLPG